MRFRTLVGSGLILIVAGLVLVDLLVVAARPLIPLLMLALAQIGWLEYARITGIAAGGPKRSPGLQAVGHGGIAYFFFLGWFSWTQPLRGGTDLWALGGLCILTILAFLVVVSRDDFEALYGALLETLLGVLAIGLFLSYFVRIYGLPGWRGPVYWAVLVAGVKGNDTAAYYVGKTWGKHLLCKVSPKKTWEGSLGAIIFSTLYFGGAAGILEMVARESPFPWYGGMLFGMIVSVASQTGDLAESLVKRVCRVKDSGAILPEFGGVLDMIDSLIFTGLLFWWLL